MKKHNNIEQGTEQWHQIRKGKISGTTLKSIMGTPKARTEAFYEVLAERLTVGVTDEGESPMERGVRLEPEALALFELHTGKEIERTGFCQDDDNEHMGNSPDALVKDNPEEAVEVKCPGGKNYIKLWILNEVPDEYHWQVVQYFVINEQLQKLYFVGYNPDIPEHPMHVIEIDRADMAEDIESARVAEEKFLGEVNATLQGIIKL